MSDLRLSGPESTPAVSTRTARPAPLQKEQAVKMGHDSASFSKKPHEGGAKHEEEHSVVEDVAHAAHNPHGALHAVEAGEHALKTAARFVGRAGRVGASAGELVHQPGHGHHGVLGKVEGWLEKGFARVGKAMSKGIAKIPGGAKLLSGADKALGVPARIMGPGLDGALQGTRLGNAVKFTGAGAGFLKAMGGRIPVIGSLLGGAIAYTDARSTMKILNDPKATTKEKVIAGAQGGLSVVSGGAGLAAIGIAGAAALGVIAAPVAVPTLLAVAAVTGIVSFGLSFFKKH